MSIISLCDYIPFEIQAEIIKRLPVESLIRFRSVSKTWNSLIGSSKFIKDHYVHQTQTQPQHLLLRYKVNNHPLCVSLVDDDTFPNNKFSYTVPEAIKQLDLSCEYGSSSHGVLCIFGHNKDLGSDIAVLWNPVVKKSVGIVIPRSISGSYTLDSLGFGVCPNTSDPKIVRINIHEKPHVHWEIEVFALSSRTWKSVSIDPPSKLCHFEYHVPIEGFVYWLGYAYGESSRTNYYIIYFDLTSEEFGEVSLPDNLVHSRTLWLSKRNETLVVLEYSKIHVCDVWMMKDVTKSLTKMYTIKSPPNIRVLGFRMNGEAIREMDEHHKNSMLEVYESCSGDFNAIGIQGDYISFYVYSYTGSLLLLDESDSIIRDGKEL